MGYNKVEYNNRYIKESYDRIMIVVPKGDRDKIKAWCKDQGKSVNAVVTGLIYKAMGCNSDDSDCCNKNSGSV